MSTPRMVTLALAAVALCFFLSASAMAGPTKSIYLLEAFNNTGQAANDFHVFIGGITLNDLDPNGYYDSDYSSRTVFEDPQGVHIYWSGGTTPIADSDKFGFTITNTTLPNPVQAYWTSNGRLIGSLPDIWQGWFSQPGLMQATIYNRSGDACSVQRTFGWSPTQTDIGSLANMPSAPAATALDQTPVAISAGSSLQYTYDRGLNASTYYMFYDVPNGPAGLLMRFRNAFSVAPDPGVQFTNNVWIGDHYWYPGSPQASNIPMLSVNAASTTGADSFQINSVQIDTGNTGGGSDIASIDVWLDTNRNGVVDTGTDVHLGSGVFPSGDHQVQISLAPAVTVPAGGSVSLLVTYTLVTPAPAANSHFECGLDSVSAVSVTSGQPASVMGLPIYEGNLIVVTAPVGIGDAKKLPINPTNGMTDYVFIQSKTMTANLQNTMGLAYLQGRSAGLGVNVAGVDGVPPAGTVISVWGRLTLLDNSEVVMIPDNGFSESTGNPPAPRAMITKAAGAGKFGNQPAVVDDASVMPSPAMAKGLSNIGMLVKICGSVTGSGQITVDGNGYSIVWIDDGCGLVDGCGGGKGIACVVPSDWTNGPPAGHIWAVGIMRAVPNPGGLPMRLLVPRSKGDILTVQ